MIEPQTPEEWQTAVELADYYLRLDAERQYGLVFGGQAVDVDRCAEILQLGESIGVIPRPDSVERITKIMSANQLEETR